MADLKISQLSSATALAGTEVVPVVQGGSTKKATIDQILAPASGKGIDFSAAGGDTLKMYDEGTWTPLISADGTGSPAFVSTSAIGSYTKIGRQVTVVCEYAYTSIGSVAGSFAVMTGLPFARASDGIEPVAFVSIDQAAFDTRTFHAIFAGTSSVYFQYNNGEGVLYGGAPYMLGVNFPAAGTVRFVMTYFAAS